MKSITIEEAIKLANNDQSLEGVLIKDLNEKQVKVQDALALSRAGIVLPEQNIYYNDDDIAYDEDIDELMFTSDVVHLTWEEKAEKFALKASRTGRLETSIDLKTENRNKRLVE